MESPFRDVGGAAELLGHPLGPKWSQKHQDGGLKSDLGSSRGGQGVSEALNGSILRRCLSLIVLFGIWYVFCKKRVGAYLVMRVSCMFMFFSPNVSLFCIPFRTCLRAPRW